MKTILCYGDSNVRGVIPEPANERKPLTKRYPKNKRWTGLLQKILGEVNKERLEKEKYTYEENNNWQEFFHRFFCHSERSRFNWESRRISYRKTL